MDWLDRKLPELAGGRAVGSGGSLYHVSFRSGSRSRGSCAVSAHDYITREHEYDDPDRDEAIHTESDHMPSWAHDSPRDYWDAADLYERANGRLYISADFALPRDLGSDDQVALAHAFAQELTAEGRLPYTLAIHAGRDTDGREHNPHVHLMISERQNDGIDRSREEWFKRANPEHPERGGAVKSRTFHGRQWVEHARQRWAEMTNAVLERAGRAERIDHRSYERQGIDRQPGRHFGPEAAFMVGRGEGHAGFEQAAEVVEDRDLLQYVDREIARLEGVREDLLGELAQEEKHSDRRLSPESGPGRDNDSSRGR